MTKVKRGIFLFILMIMAGRPDSGFGWSRYGHQVAATIVERLVSPETRQEIEALLGEGVSLVDISAWADNVKTNRRVVSKWHYVYIPRAVNYYDPQRDCPKGGCLISAIEHFQDVLADRNAGPDKREEALKFLVHLVADLHQPLHCGFREDRGGKGVRVRFIGKKSNLHKVWDTDILAHDQMGFAGYVRRLLQNVTPRRSQKWMEGNIEDWVFESRALLLGHVYRFYTDRKLDEAYYSKSLPVVDEQLLKSGVRLANMLDTIFTVYRQALEPEVPEPIIPD